MVTYIKVEESVVRSQAQVVVPGAMLLIRTLVRIPDLQYTGLLTAGHVRPVGMVSTRPYISCMLSQTGYLLYVIPDWISIVCYPRLNILVVCLVNAVYQLYVIPDSIFLNK